MVNCVGSSLWPFANVFLMPAFFNCLIWKLPFSFFPLFYLGKQRCVLNIILLSWRFFHCRKWYVWLSFSKFIVWFTGNGECSDVTMGFSNDWTDFIPRCRKLKLLHFGFVYQQNRHLDAHCKPDWLKPAFFCQQLNVCFQRL